MNHGENECRQLASDQSGHSLNVRVQRKRRVAINEEAPAATPGLLSFRSPAGALVVPKSNAMLDLRGAGQGVALLAIKAGDTAGVASNLKYTRRNQFARYALLQAGAERQVYS
jgi:hypothetical protein